MIFFKIIKVLNLLGFPNLRLIGVVFLFLLLALLDLIGLSLLAPYLKSIMQQSIPDSFYSIVEFLTGRNFSFMENILIMSTIILALYIFKAFFSLYVLHRIFLLAETVQAKLKVLLVGHALAIDFSEFSKRNSASFQYNINMVASAFSQKVILVSLRLLSDGLILASVILFFAFYDFQIFVFIFFITAISLVLIKVTLTKKIANQGALTNIYNRKIVQSVNESLDGIKEIKASGNEVFIYNSISEYAWKYAILATRFQWLSSLPRYSLETLFITIFVSGVLLVGAEDFAGRLPGVAVLAFAVIRLIPVLSNVLNSTMQITFGLEAFKLIMDDIDKVASSETHNKEFKFKSEKANTLNLDQRFETLELLDVSLRYDTSTTYLFENVNFKIRNGSFVVILGQSGVGKTSLLDTIAGLIEPNSGRITVNNDKSLFRSDWWKSKIAYLPQDSFLFDASIRYNVVMGQEESKINTDKLKSAIKIACLEEFISQQENGLDALVGDKGMRISGGQKQRIALARALYSDSEVLLLDEATSALDSKTENKVLANLCTLKGERTVIAISHSVKSLNYFDTQIHLSKTGVVFK
jgi:ATP-binding cassette, subfamily B, bacterial PglK